MALSYWWWAETHAPDLPASDYSSIYNNIASTIDFGDAIGSSISGYCTLVNPQTYTYSFWQNQYGCPDEYYDYESVIGADSYTCIYTGGAGDPYTYAYTCSTTIEVTYGTTVDGGTTTVYDGAAATSTGGIATVTKTSSTSGTTTATTTITPPPVTTSFTSTVGPKIRRLKRSPPQNGTFHEEDVELKELVKRDEVSCDGGFYCSADQACLGYSTFGPGCCNGAPWGCVSFDSLGPLSSSEVHSWSWTWDASTYISTFTTFGETDHEPSTTIGVTETDTQTIYVTYFDTDWVTETANAPVVTMTFFTTVLSLSSTRPAKSSQLTSSKSSSFPTPTSKFSTVTASFSQPIPISAFDAQSYTGQKLLTGTCSDAAWTVIPFADGSVYEVPMVGCDADHPDCCPSLNPSILGDLGGLRKRSCDSGGSSGDELDDLLALTTLDLCPGDYTAVTSLCCPSGFTIYGEAIASGIQTPCVSSVAAGAIPTPDQADQASIDSAISSITSACVASTATSNTNVTVSVTVVTTSVFALSFQVHPRSSGGLSEGGKIGAGVGAGVGGGIALIGALFAALFLVRRRRRRSDERARDPVQTEYVGPASTSNSNYVGYAKSPPQFSTRSTEATYVPSSSPSGIREVENVSPVSNGHSAHGYGGFNNGGGMAPGDTGHHSYQHLPQNEYANIPVASTARYGDGQYGAGQETGAYGASWPRELQDRNEHHGSREMPTGQDPQVRGEMPAGNEAPYHPYEIYAPSRGAYEGT